MGTKNNEIVYSLQIVNIFVPIFPERLKWKIQTLLCAPPPAPNIPARKISTMGMGETWIFEYT